jgi:cytoskeleton protein RodZ
MGFGETLRRERESRKISLSEVAASTKISRRYLQAVEEEELDRLPGGVFNRGFVRTYAAFLSLDPEPLVRDLERASEPPREVILPPVRRSGFRQLLAFLRFRSEL